MALTQCRKCGLWTRSNVCGACGAPVSDTGKFGAARAGGNITLGQGLFGLALLVLIVVVVVWSDQAPPGARERAGGDHAAPTRSYTAPSKPRTVVVGTLADTVLAWRGKPLSTAQVGRDDQGLLIEWRYPDATYLMGRRLQGGIEAYRVITITPGS